MARWQGGAPQRLRAAALDQFVARGFDGTTVADIAAAAGLTERTFFRHYADKREVLFHGQDEFERRFADAMAETPGDDPMTLIRAALAGAAGWFDDERRPTARARQQVIEGHEALRERELLKLAGLARLLAGALVTRGVDPVSAALAAETGVAAFRTAFTAWIGADETRSFTAVQDEVLARLHTLVTG